MKERAPPIAETPDPQDRTPATRKAGGKSADTRARILEAATTLFARRGVAKTTLREITALAGVNMAAVNYHFGSKEVLANAVFAAVSARANGWRRDRIAECLDRATASGTRPDLGELIDIFLHPYLDRAEPSASMLLVHLVMLHRVDPTPWTHKVIAENYDELATDFVAALRLALPGLSGQELWWRYYFLPGTVIFALTEARGSERLRRLSGGGCDIGDWPELKRQLRATLVNAFAGPHRAGPEAGGSGAAARSAERS